jgi:1-acyl-sn-glycerol-3-phosphate acyltransferase
MVLLLLPLFALNTLVHAIVVFYAILIAKTLLPLAPWRRLCDRGLVWVSITWTIWNTRLFKLGGLRIREEVAPDIHLTPDRRYLILANHQTWTDILVLQGLFHPRTPFLTFFLKKQLLYVPVFGLIWKALGFPFMERYSAERLTKDPSLKGKDLETTRRFCARLRGRPYAIINFVEGTRRTPKKAAASPFRHLLPPKAGGVATALDALDYGFDHVLDVTLRYERRTNSFWDLLSGRVGTVHVDVREAPLQEIPRGDYFRDEAHAARFRDWLNGVWQAKDQRMAASPRITDDSRQAG